MRQTETAPDHPASTAVVDGVSATHARVNAPEPELLIAGPERVSWPSGAVLRPLLRRLWLLSLVVSVTVLGCSVLAGRPWVMSGEQSPDTAAGAASPTVSPRLSPEGHLATNAGVPTILDEAAWLPVGSDLIRFDADTKPLPVGAALLRIQPATGAVTGQVSLRSTGSFTFALGTSIAVTTSDGAEVINPKTLRRERVLPGGQAVAYGSIWDVRDGTLLRINPNTGQVTGRVQLPNDQGRYQELHLATAAGSVWVGLGVAASVLRINPHTLRTIAALELDAVPGRLVVGSGYGHLWATQSIHGSGKLFRIDPATNRITGTTQVGDPLIGNAPGNGGRTIGFGNRSVWTCDSSGTLTRVDPVTTQIQSIRKLPFDSCTWLSVGAGSIWASTDALDPHPNTIRTNP